MTADPYVVTVTIVEPGRGVMPPRHVADHPYAEPCAYVDRCGHVADGRNRDGVTACRWHGGAA